MTKFKKGDMVKYRDNDREHTLIIVDVYNDDNYSFYDYKVHKSDFPYMNYKRVHNIESKSLERSYVLLGNTETTNVNIINDSCSHQNKRMVFSTIQSYWLCDDCKEDLGDVK